MDGVSAIGSAGSGGVAPRPQPTGGAEAAGSASDYKRISPSPDSGSNLTGSINSLSISQSSMSMGVELPAAASNNELLGAVLLMLLLEYMQSTDEEERNRLLGAIGLMAALQSQSQSGSFFYSQSSLSIESTQIQFGGGDAAANAYAAGGPDPQQAPPTDGAGGGSIDTVV